MTWHGLTEQIGAQTVCASTIEGASLSDESLVSSGQKRDQFRPSVDILLDSHCSSYSRI